MLKKELQTALDKALKQVTQLQYDLEQSNNKTETVQEMFNKTVKEQEELINQAITLERVTVRDIASGITLWNFRRVKTKLLNRNKK